MRIITLNVNGIRSAARKGLFEWLRRQDADVVCLQEIKCARLSIWTRRRSPRRSFYRLLRAGREKRLQRRRAAHARASGRPGARLRHGGVRSRGPLLEVRFGDLSVVSVYMPSGSAGEHRQASKFRFMKVFMEHLRRIRADGRRYIVCGDWNIAHRAIDLRNWRSNQKNSGFLPEERAWMDQVFERGRFRRRVPPHQSGARAVHLVVQPRTGLGEECRLAHRLPDHLTGTRATRCCAARIYKHERFSDHAPLIMDYEIARP